MSSLEEIFMPDDVGQSVENSVEETVNTPATVSSDEFDFDDLFDSDDKPSVATEPVAEVVESETMTDPVAEAEVLEVAEVSDQVGEVAVAAELPEAAEPEVKESGFDPDNLGKAFNRVLSLSKWIRELRVYLKSQQEEVKETKKNIEDAMERMLIITEELGMQVDGLDLPEVEDTADPAEPVEEKAKADPVAEEVAPETNEPEADAITPPGPNKRPKTVIITKDIRDGEVHIFSQGEIVEVADVSENEGNLWVYQGPADSSESVEIVAGEYEVDTWSELPSDPDDEWEDVPDDEAENEGGLTWEQCSCSKANVAAFLDIGIKEPSDLVGKTVEDLTKASGIGPKKAEKILAAVESSLEPE